MSHELRTPLNAILGFAEMLGHDHNVTAEQQEKLSVINRSGEHLLSMINDVLDLSKIEAGRRELEPRDFDLSQMLRDICDMFDIRAGKAQLRLEREINSESEKYIRADLGKLRQILINLLGNAVKFTPEGWITLRVRTEPATDDPTSVILRLEVEDSGPGIPPEQLEHIFEPFVQVQEGQRVAKGTGLGLTITNSFVELMGGEISVESELGKGSLFRVNLPIVPAEAAESFEPETSRQQVLGLEPDQTEQRILVAEDNPENRLLLTSLLAEAGFNAVRTAENGERAVALFKKWKPHFIWMNMRMPVMNGSEATALIRALPGGESVKIVALTGSAFREQHRKILEAGCDEVLCKPFRSSEIFESMRSHLNLRYIYRENHEEVEQVAPLPSLTAAIMTELPDEQKKALRTAAQKLDIPATEKVIKEIRNEHPDVASRLQVLAREFRFGQILELLT